LGLALAMVPGRRLGEAAEEVRAMEAIAAHHSALSAC
jgi:hypothetical protein